MRPLVVLLLCGLFQCRGQVQVRVQCWDFSSGDVEVSCDREWTEREAEGHCGEQTRPCAVHKLDQLNPDTECGTCIQLQRALHPPIWGKIIGGNVGSGSSQYRITRRAFNKFRYGTESENSCHSTVTPGNMVTNNCHVEAKCRDFMPNEPGTCNCATEDSDFENCGDDASNPCVVAMEDAGPLGVNQCNECYQLQLPGSSLLHVRVVDKFDPPVEDDDEWRMQVPRYVYDRLRGAPFLDRPQGRDQPEELNACADPAPPVNIVYTTTRCYDGPVDLCPQIGETTTSTTTEEPTTTSTTTEEPTTTSTTEEPTTTSTTTEEPTTTSTTTEEPTTTSTTEEPTTTSTAAEEPTTTLAIAEKDTTTETTRPPTTEGAVLPTTVASATVTTEEEGGKGGVGALVYVAIAGSSALLLAGVGWLIYTDIARNDEPPPLPEAAVCEEAADSGAMGPQADRFALVGGEEGMWA